MSQNKLLVRLGRVNQRINYTKPLAPALHHLLQIEEHIAASGLPHSIIKLVKLRASQINGCGFCLHMHTREALEAGEAIERLGVVAAFRESSLFTPAEAAALAWTEALTLTHETPTDAQFAALQAHFDDSAIAHLTLVIGMINLWNRMAVAMQTPHPEEPLTRITPSHNE